MIARPLVAALLATALLLLSACSDPEGSAAGRAQPAEGAWQTPGAGQFVEVGDLAVATVPSDDADLLDVMAVTADGEVAWRSTVPALPDGLSVVTYETHRPSLHTSNDVVVLHHHVDDARFPGSSARPEALTAFDALTGEHLWTERARASRVEAVTEEHLVLADPDQEHLLTVLDPRTGRDLGVHLGRPTERGTFLVGTADGVGFLAGTEDRGTYVTALDLGSGKKLWRARTEPPTNSLRDALGLSSFVAATSRGVLLQLRGTADEPDRVELREVRTGRVVSTTEVAVSSAVSVDPSSQVAVLHGGGVDPLEPSPRDAMSAIDLTTGELLWHVPATEAQEKGVMYGAVGAGRLWIEAPRTTFVGDVRKRPTTYERTRNAPPRGEIILGRFDSPLDGPPETIPDLE